MYAKLSIAKCNALLLTVCLKHTVVFVVVRVNFTISRTISVTEGDVVRLRGEAFGNYANEVAIGVECSETIVTDVEPGMDIISGTDASMLRVGVV